MTNRIAVSMVWLAWGCGAQQGLEAQAPDALAREDDDSGGDEGPLFAATDVVEGQTLSEWNARFWEWLVSIPAEHNPVRGFDCTQNNDGPVFFLAGTQGTGPAVRSCVVPEGVPIFIPTTNVISFPCAEVWGESHCPLADPAVMLQSARDRQKARASTLTYAVTLDGVELQGLDAYHLQGELAWLDYQGDLPSLLLREKDRYGEGLPPVDTDCARGWGEGNVCGLEPGPKAAGTWGHGVMLRPLDDDESHLLHVVGTAGTFVVDVTYELTVGDDD